MKRNHLLSAPAGVLLLLLLGACGGPGTATPTSGASGTTSASSASPTPSATTTPAPEQISATLVLVLPNSIGVHASGSGGALADYDYFTPIGTISAGFTGFFGFAPVVTHIDASPEGDGVSYTRYEWEGFALHDWDKPASRDPYIPEFQVSSTVGSVRGISIETAGNSRVGDPTDTVAALNSDVSSFTGEGGVSFTTIRVFPMDPVNGRYGPISLAVRLDGRTGGVIELMLSPWPDMQM